MGESRRRVAVILGVLAIVLAWLTAVPLAHEFDGLAAGDLPWAPDGWAAAYDDVHDTVGEPLGLSAYYFWGKPAFLMYAAALLLTTVLPTGVGRWSRVGMVLLRGALVAGLVGDVAGYWGGWGSDEMTAVTGYAFSFVEVWALLLIVVSLGVVGVGYVRDRVRPRWTGWFLVTAAVLTVPIVALVVGYVPHGVLLPVLTALVVVAAARPQPVGGTATRGTR